MFVLKETILSRNFPILCAVDERSIAILGGLHGESSTLADAYIFDTETAKARKLADTFNKRGYSRKYHSV